MNGLYRALRRGIENTTLLRELKYRLIGPLHSWNYRRLPEADKKRSEESIRAVLDCPDYATIPRVPGAGQVHGGRQTMHNGVTIIAGSYYGHWLRKMFEETGGVHEPQEERVFAEVLRHMPARATMIELGAYWGFYSLWFHSVVKEPNCYLVEPILSNLNYGRKNFQINGMKAHFTQAFLGESAGKMEGIDVICVDDFVAQNKIEHIDILHADIQEAEVKMLRGAPQSIAREAIDYIFLSTHSNELHDQCRRFLVDHGFVILASANLDESYALDGVLVARRANKPGAEPVPISIKPKRAL
jgi:hypothetical protein